jgi:beta-lactamase class A
MMRPWFSITAASGAILLALCSNACAQAQTIVAGAPAAASTPVARADTGRLRRALDSLANAHRGIVGYAVRNLDTGERLERRAAETFPTASLIKVSILVSLFDLIEKGQVALTDPIHVLRIDKVGGSGVLQFLHDGVDVTVGDAAWLMTTLSDNTATNLLLDKVAIRRVWEKMESLGLRNTKVHSKTFQRFTSVAMDSSVKYGLGVTTPGEMATLFALLANGKAVSPTADSTMLEILAHNTDDTKLQRFVSGLRVPHKTGDVDQARSECALFELQSRVVVCVLTKENVDKRYGIENEAHLMMANMGVAIVGAWPRKSAP